MTSAAVETAVPAAPPLPPDSMPQAMIYGQPLVDMPRDLYIPPDALRIFLEAFEGPMSNLQRFVAGDDAALASSVEDAYKTMAVVEACYESSVHGATPIPADG